METKTRVRELRNSFGYSIRKLAEITKLSPSTISRIEAGKMKISSDQATKIASAFRVSVDYLIGSNISVAIDKFIDSNSYISEHETNSEVDPIEQERFLCIKLIAQMPKSEISGLYRMLKTFQACNVDFKDELNKKEGE